MKTILEDYQRKLKTVNDELDKYDLNDIDYMNSASNHELERITRLLTKQSEYCSFITDIERMIIRNS